MIDDLKPYPAMKASGVPWLSEMPEHWHVKRLKSHVANIVDQIDRREPGEIYVALEHVESWTGRIRDAGSDITFDSQVKRFCAGDVLFGKLRPYLAKVALATSPGVCVGEFFVLRPHHTDMSAPYLEHLLRSKPIIDAINGSTFGAKMPRADWQFVGGMELSFPPLPEQAAIVRFLDHADRLIRRYIATKQKLIKLLNEQKQTIVHHAVTRGTDPNVRFKSSGVPWLGDVPEHWEIVRSGAMFRLFGGFAFPGGGFVRDESHKDLPVLLTPVNFDPVGGLRFGAKSSVRFQGHVPEQFKLRKNDLVTVLTDLSSKRLILARAGFIPEDGVLLNQRTARIDVHRSAQARLDARFLCCVLNTSVVREQTIATSRGSTVFHTSPTRMLAARWALPPIEEQYKIAENLDRIEKTYRVASEKLYNEIDLIREYHTRLIADVVTGKLDVREAAARLPDETEQLDQLEDIEEGEALADDELEQETLTEAA